MSGSHNEAIEQALHLQVFEWGQDLGLVPVIELEVFEKLFHMNICQVGSFIFLIFQSHRFEIVLGLWRVHESSLQRSLGSKFSHPILPRGLGH